MTSYGGLLVVFGEGIQAIMLGCFFHTEVS
jgi:hypothetical protein